MENKIDIAHAMILDLAKELGTKFAFSFEPSSQYCKLFQKQKDVLSVGCMGVSFCVSPDEDNALDNSLYMYGYKLGDEALNGCGNIEACKFFIKEFLTEKAFEQEQEMEREQARKESSSLEKLKTGLKKFW